MIFGHFLLDVNESNAYVVGCEETGAALLVDVADWPPEIPSFLRSHNLHLHTIFITHDHYDHTGGLARAVSATHARVVSGSGRAGGMPVTRVVSGEIVHWGNLQGRVAATPGHTPESISLILPGMVFTGDALFAGSVGGVSSAACARQQCAHITKHIFSLSPQCHIYPGHGPASTVAVEKGYNPFFR